MKKPFLSIVIPAYNEETNIRLGALEKVAKYLTSLTYTWELVIVDDGSRDATAKLIEDFVAQNAHCRLIKNPHRGKAGTVITGIVSSLGDIVLFTDLDQATPIREIEKVLPWFEKGYDVVIGSREGRREGAPLLRRLMARGFMTLRTHILGLKGISDTQCGFKAFKGSAIRSILDRLSLYGKQKSVTGAMVTAGFDIEVLFLASTLGFRIKEVPVEWHYVETRRVNPIADTIQGLRDIIQIRINAWTGVYAPKKQ